MFKTDLGGSQKHDPKKENLNWWLAYVKERKVSARKNISWKENSMLKGKRGEHHECDTFNGTENNLEIYLACYTGCWL